MAHCLELGMGRLIQLISMSQQGAPEQDPSKRGSYTNRSIPISAKPEPLMLKHLGLRFMA